jgi:hypothetical protein
MQLTIPALNEGERWAGVIVADGKATHHVILLPGECDAADWHAATAWAIAQGGELPTRREQALLFANAPEQFKRAAYWSGEQHAADPDYAWYQHFGYGGQDDHTIDDQLRARAVRRVAI